MTHYTINCDWGCKYIDELCERCGESILYYRDRWIKHLGEKIYNSLYDSSSPENIDLKNKLLEGKISIEDYFKISNEKRFIKINVSSLSPPSSLEELEPWQKDPDNNHCWIRIVKGGDPNNVRDRRVFIEKTPRVFDPSLNLDILITNSWIQGLKGSYCTGNNFDEYARYWSNVMAKTLGYKVKTSDGL